MSPVAGRLPSLYIPHGGGPCFFMDTPPGLPRDLWDGMGAYLRGIDASVGVRPKAVLVVFGTLGNRASGLPSTPRHGRRCCSITTAFQKHTYLPHVSGSGLSGGGASWSRAARGVRDALR